ncbi:hypothetical protein MCC93_12080 [Morococcus cerebrosus]|uniref:Uncharacterized protein n=1 Tax=Morococcus cerebrosus TaxID=1056807 RepID=A0A0C1EH71_9NEIS|nr:hypothetical protein MCC93_12080 [Morococcus cerebrosus]
MEGLYRIEMKMIPECAGGRLKMCEYNLVCSLSDDLFTEI